MKNKNLSKETALNTKIAVLSKLNSFTCWLHICCFLAGYSLCAFFSRGFSFRSDLRWPWKVATHEVIEWPRWQTKVYFFVWKRYSFGIVLSQKYRQIIPKYKRYFVLLGVGAFTVVGFYSDGTTLRVYVYKVVHWRGLQRSGGSGQYKHGDWCYIQCNLLI